MKPPSPTVLSELAPTGTLRAGINLGNIVLAQQSSSGELGGITIDLTRELGRQLGLPVTFTTFDTAGKVVDAIPSNTLDIVFLAIDPVRAADITFTPPYVIIEGSYLVRDASPLRQIEDFDRSGIQIAVGKGAAYDLYLTRALKHASLVRSDTSAKAIDMFIATNLDAVAGVRQPLVVYAEKHPGFRVIPGRFTAIDQAMGTPKGRPAALEYLRSFIETMKGSGFVAEALARSNQHDASVAPPQA